MITVIFKKSSGAAEQSFEAVSVIPKYTTDEDRYTTIDHEKKRVVYAKHKVWEIKFGFLSESDMDYLEELKVEEEPQMILDSVTYNIEVQRLSARYKGGSIIVAKREAE